MIVTKLISKLTGNLKNYDHIFGKPENFTDKPPVFSPGLNMKNQNLTCQFHPGPT